MSDDEAEFSSNHLVQNKKLTMYAIDASRKMFEGGNQCKFRMALKAVFDQALKVCCSGSLSQMIALLLFNTGNNVIDKFTKKQNISVWFPLSFFGKSEMTEIKEFLDSDDIYAAFLKKFKGHGIACWNNVLYECRFLFRFVATSTRAQSIWFFSSDRAPFSAYVQPDLIAKKMKQFQTTINDFVAGPGKKTNGEFHISFLASEDEFSDDQIDYWIMWMLLKAAVVNIYGCQYYLGNWLKIGMTQNFAKTQDPTLQFYTGEENLPDEVFQRSVAQRSFSNIPFELAPGVVMNVGVYSIVAEAKMPTRVPLDAETGKPLERKQFWLPHGVDASDESQTGTDANETIAERMREKHDLKRMVRLGGEELVADLQEAKTLSHFDAKGIVLMGFRPLDKLDVEKHVESSRFIFPNEGAVQGSMRLYKSLLDRCYDRKMAIIARFCSRANQKVRLVALIPEKKETAEHNQGKDWELRSVFQHEGFHAVTLPYAEDIRNIDEKLKCPIEGSDWPKPSDVDVDVSASFVRRLNGEYAPDVYDNPRLMSFQVMLTEHALGEKVVDVRDSLLPYHKRNDVRGYEKAMNKMLEHFHCTQRDLEEIASTQAEPKTRGAKRSSDEPINYKELAKKGKLSSMTIAELKTAVVELTGTTVKAATKKADIVDILNKFFNK